MSTTSVPTTTDVVYPESDGKPMAESTRQFRWIVTIKEGLDAVFGDREDVFVAGDLFWYPLQGFPKIVQAPDAMVVLGRPKGDRGSYKQWEEEGVGPQVAFEVLSPSNTSPEMAEKRAFYERHGVQEYYEYDPERERLRGWIRDGNLLISIPSMKDWTSPLLGIRFEPGPHGLRLLRPDGRPFETYQDVFHDREAKARLAESERQRAERAGRRARAERQKAEAERQRAEAERQRAEAERQRANALAERLRALGIDPDSLP